MPVTTSFSLINAAWSLGLFLLAVAVLLWKLHRMRLEVHALVVALPTMGSEFVRREIEELKQEVDRTRVRVSICEEQLGLNGQER